MRRVATKKEAVLVALVLSFSLVGLEGCTGDSDPKNRVTRLRVLAIQSDPPALEFGETASIRGLVFESEGKDEVTYEWSWCPFPTGRATGYECAISEGDIRAMMDEAFPGSSGLLPAFSLGGGSETTFPYTLPSQALKTICEQVLQVELPAFVEIPTCDGEIDIVVKLRVTQGSEEVTAIKNIALLLDDTIDRNTNPVLGKIVAADETPPADGPIEILEDGSVSVKRGREYRLEVDISESEAESYVPSSDKDSSAAVSTRETLFVSWYVTGGETDFSRTSYIDGKIEFDKLGENFWRVPMESEYENQSLQLFVVLQDNRGGVGWIERTVGLTE